MKYINKIIIPLIIVKNTIKENQWDFINILIFIDKIKENWISSKFIEEGWIHLLFKGKEFEIKVIIVNSIINEIV